MDMKKYTELRAVLMTEAKSALDAGDLAAAREKREKIEALDKEKESYDRELAGIEALRKMDIAAPKEPEACIVPVGGVPLKAEPTIKEREIEAFKAFLVGEPYDAAMLRKAPDISNSANQASANAVIIPETVRDSIWKEMGERHPILSALRMTFVKGDLSIIKESSSGDEAAWYDEPTSVVDGAVSFVKLDLKGYELAKAVPITWMLKKMSMDAFLPYVISLIAEKMGNALAKAVVEGKGVAGSGDPWKSQPQGIAVALEAESGTPQVVTYTASTDEIDYDKFCDVMAKIKSGYYGGCAIYAKNVMIWTKLATIKDADGRPYFVTDPTSGGVGRIFGLTVYEEDAVSDDEILVGNIAAGYVANCNENVSLYQEEHVKERYTDYMGYAIVDGKVLTTKAFVLIKKSA